MCGVQISQNRTAERTRNNKTLTSQNKAVVHRQVFMSIPVWPKRMRQGGLARRESVEHGLPKELVVRIGEGGFLQRVHAQI